MDTQAIVSSLSSLSSLASDWGIVVALFLVVGVDCVRSGTGRAVALAVSLPLATLISMLVPTTAFLGSFAPQLSTPYGTVGLFLVSFVGAYVLVRRMTISYGDIGGEILVSLFVTTAVVVLILTFWVSTPALSVAWTFGPFFQSVFAHGYMLWWLLVSYAILAVSRG